MLRSFYNTWNESFLCVEHTASSGKRPGKKRNRDDGLQYNLLSEEENYLSGKSVLKLSIPML